MSAGMLLDMGTMNPTHGQTLVRRVKVQSEHLEDALTFMREGRAYVNVMTTQHSRGEVRGQLVVPHCIDGELMGPNHYGFANIMVSPDPGDKSVAMLVQVLWMCVWQRCTRAPAHHAEFCTIHKTQSHTACLRVLNCKLIG